MNGSERCHRVSAAFCTPPRWAATISASSAPPRCWVSTLSDSAIHGPYSKRTTYFAAKRSATTWFTRLRCAPSRSVLDRPCIGNGPRSWVPMKAVAAARVGWHWEQGLRFAEAGAAWHAAGVSARLAGQLEEQGRLFERAARCHERAGNREAEFESLLARLDGLHLREGGVARVGRPARDRATRRVFVATRSLPKGAHRSHARAGARRAGSGRGHACTRRGRPPIRDHDRSARTTGDRPSTESPARGCRGDCNGGARGSAPERQSASCRERRQCPYVCALVRWPTEPGGRSSTRGTCRRRRSRRSCARGCIRGKLGSVAGCRWGCTEDLCACFGSAKVASANRTFRQQYPAHPQSRRSGCFRSSPRAIR